MASSSSSLILIISCTFFLIFILSSLPTNHAKANVTVFIEEVLEGHNTVRQTVGVPPLVYEPMLARVARVYANERRHDCNVVNSPWKAFGETVYTAPGKNWTVKDAIASWASEEQWYNATSNTCADGKDCTDYTQIVWRTTMRIGCARVVCDNGDAYIACEYYPPGNYIGARPY